MAPEDIAKKTIDALAMPLGKRSPALAPVAAPSLFDVLPKPTPPLASPPENLAPSPDAERLKNKPLALEWLWTPISELKNRHLVRPGGRSRIL